MRLKLITLTLVITAILFGTASPVYAGKNNNFSQGGKWNKQENNKCRSGCTSYDPSYGGAATDSVLLSKAPVIYDSTTTVNPDGTVTVILAPGQTMVDYCSVHGCTAAQILSTTWQINGDTSTSSVTMGDTTGAVTSGGQIAGFYSQGGLFYPIVVTPSGNGNGNNDPNPTGTPTPTPTPPAFGVIAGTVYYDPDNTCSTSQPWNKSGALKVTLRDTGDAVTVNNGTGAFSLFEPAKTYNNLDLATTGGYYCSTGCLSSCPTRTSVVSPSNGNNFFITDKQPGWWQAVGAGIYAGDLSGGVTVRSQMPLVSDTLIAPGVGGAIGALIRGSGNLNMGYGSVSTPGFSTKAQYKGEIMNFEFFTPKLGVLPKQGNDWATDAMDKPTYDAARDFYYLYPVSGTATIDVPWVVASGESYVVFVEGDLRVNQNITVANGGFLAIISKGDITIDPAVTKLQGLYVMDKRFITESQYVKNVTNDVQLQVQGSVVSWGGIVLDRNLNLGNSTTPAEQFTYRPDLITNMPEKMKVFPLEWQEVVPGTFGQ